MRKRRGAAADGTTVFAIFRNHIGRWCARRADGLIFGTFFERDDAVHFARHECRDVRRLKLIFAEEGAVRT